MKKYMKNRLLALFIGLVLLSGCESRKDTIHIATKPMSEQFILGEMLALLIEENSDLHVKITKGVGGGTSNIHPAMVKGDFDLYPEYTGTGWLVILKKDSLLPPGQLFSELQKEYSREYGLKWVAPYGFNNAYSLAVSNEMAKKYNSQVIIDASQSLGLLDINMNNLMADFIAFAGHKNLYGPFGTSGFFVRKGTKINPFIAGGTGSDSLNLNMPKTIPAMLEPASPNIVAVAGMEAALDETIGRISDFEAKEKELTEYLVKGLEKIENVTTYLPLEDSHIGIVAFNIEGYKAEDVGTILDQDYHIAVRTGYHCAPLIHKHLMDIEKGGVVRASVGRYTTRNDIEKLLEAVEELSEEM